MSKRIGLFVGDRYGIGPEIVAKYLSKFNAGSGFQLLVLGDRAVLERGAQSTNISLKIDTAADFSAAFETPWVFFDQPVDCDVQPVGQVSSAAGRETLAALDALAQAALEAKLDGIVYAPLNKQAMKLAGHAAADELDIFVQKMHPTAPTGEINILGDLWTSRVTSHVPLRDVADLLSVKRVTRGIELLATALKSAGRANPKIAVAALNPHAGEGGAFGSEEIEILTPAILLAQAAGLNIVGPLPSDSIFPRVESQKIDGVVTMFHDQGQIALKLMGLGQGVTLLAGLPVPVATPGHGTAFDIAGQGIAREDGLAAAVSLVATMASKPSGRWYV